MNRTITATDARTPTQIFFDIELDDAELNPYEFRIYSRIVRRAAGGQSECFESLEAMALACKMSRKTAVYAIKELIKRKMVQRISRTGETSIYAVLDKTCWQPGNSGNHHPVTQGTTTRYLTVPPPGNSEYHPLVTQGTTKNIKKETTKKTKKESPSASPKSDSIYDLFAENFFQKRSIPYLNKKADFIQLAELKKKCVANSWELTAERFLRAVNNYFVSELGTFTLAHLCSNFTAFFNSPLDRFGQPLQNRSHQNGTNGANTSGVQVATSRIQSRRIPG